MVLPRAMDKRCFGGHTGAAQVGPHGYTTGSTLAFAMQSRPKCIRTYAAAVYRAPIGVCVTNRTMANRSYKVRRQFTLHQWDLRGKSNHSTRASTDAVEPNCAFTTSCLSSRPTMRPSALRTSPYYGKPHCGRYTTSVRIMLDVSQNHSHNSMA